MALPLYSLDKLILNYAIPDATQTYLWMLEEKIESNKAFTQHYYSYASGFVTVTVMAECYGADQTSETFEYDCDVSDIMIGMMAEVEYEHAVTLRHNILNAGLRDKAWEHRMVFGL